MPTLCRPIPLLLLLLVCGCAHTGAPPLGVPLTPNLEFIETWSLCGPFPPGGSPELEKSWNRADLDSEEACEMIRQQRFRALTGEAGWRERGIESFQSLSRDTFTKEMRSLPARGLNLLNAFPSRNTQCSAYALT
ncbi:hypothetical protein HQ520_03600, partial [bacterium]|nr:hypothetical protein [bacterium]